MCCALRFFCLLAVAVDTSIPPIPLDAQLRGLRWGPSATAAQQSKCLVQGGLVDVNALRRPEEQEEAYSGDRWQCAKKQTCELGRYHSGHCGKTESYRRPRPGSREFDAWFATTLWGLCFSERTEQKEKHSPASLDEMPPPLHHSAYTRHVGALPVLDRLIEMRSVVPKIDKERLCALASESQLFPGGRGGEKAAQLWSCLYLQCRCGDGMLPERSSSVLDHLGEMEVIVPMGGFETLCGTSFRWCGGSTWKVDAKLSDDVCRVGLSDVDAAPWVEVLWASGMVEEVTMSLRSAPGREPLAAAAGTVPAGERDYAGLDVLTAAAAAEDSDELEAQCAHHASNLKNLEDLEVLAALAAQCAPEQAPTGSSAAGTLETLSGLRLAGPQGRRSQSTPPPAQLCREHGIPLHKVAERVSSSHTPQFPDMWMTAGMLVVRGPLRLARNGEQFSVWQLQDAMGGHLSMCLFGRACRGQGVGTWARAEQGDVYFFMTPRLFRGQNGTWALSVYEEAQVLFVGKCVEASGCQQRPSGPFGFVCSCPRRPSAPAGPSAPMNPSTPVDGECNDGECNACGECNKGDGPSAPMNPSAPGVDGRGSMEKLHTGVGQLTPLYALPRYSICTDCWLSHGICRGPVRLLLRGQLSTGDSRPEPLAACEYAWQLCVQGLSDGSSSLPVRFVGQCTIVLTLADLGTAVAEDISGDRFEPRVSVQYNRGFVVPQLTTTSPPLTTAHHRSPAPILNHPCVHKFNLIRAWGGEGRNARNHTGVARSSCQCVEHSQRRLLLRLSDYHARHASGGVDGQRAVLPPNQQVVWVVKERRGGCRLQRRQMARR